MKHQRIHDWSHCYDEDDVDDTTPTPTPNSTGTNRHHNHRLPLVHVEERYANGDRYSGTVLVAEAGQERIKSGKGVYTFADGSVYSGEWTDGFMEGYGTFVEALTTKDRCEGQWMRGRRVYGSYFYGGRQGGSTDTDTDTGMGGREYHGPFGEDGVSKHGQALVVEGGQVFEALYENDRLIHKTPSAIQPTLTTGRTTTTTRSRQRDNSRHSVGAHQQLQQRAYGDDDHSGAAGSPSTSTYVRYGPHLVPTTTPSPSRHNPQGNTPHLRSALSESVGEDKENWSSHTGNKKQTRPPSTEEEEERKPTTSVARPSVPREKDSRTGTLQRREHTPREQRKVAHSTTATGGTAAAGSPLNTLKASRILEERLDRLSNEALGAILIASGGGRPLSTEQYFAALKLQQRKRVTSQGARLPHCAIGAAGAGGSLVLKEELRRPGTVDPRLVKEAMRFYKQYPSPTAAAGRGEH